MSAPKEYAAIESPTCPHCGQELEVEEFIYACMRVIRRLSAEVGKLNAEIVVLRNVGQSST